MTRDDDRDAVDLLFAHLEQVEPPPDLLARVMARAQEGRVARWPRWQRTLFAIGYVTALALLGVLSFLIGSELEQAHLRDLLSLAVHDISIISDAPGVYLAALRDAIPWQYVLMVLGDIVLLVVATRFLLKAATPSDGESRKLTGTAV